MSDETAGIIFVPFSRKLYDDVVRCSGGKLDPVYMAEDQLESWIARDLEGGFQDHWGDHFEEMAAEYAPHVLDELAAEQAETLDRLREKNKPLVWKGVAVAPGSEVRMAYGGTHHYAKVEQGAIVDDGKSYSPSEWARKVAEGTSRNAWRDLWFRERGAAAWVPAQLLRDQARQAIEAHTGSDGDA